MASTLQIRNVPDAVHSRLKARAAEAGMSLSEYLLAEVTRFAALPTRDEMRTRLRRRPRTKLTESAAKMVRRERDSA
jgi:plasmid stability protein